MTSAKIRITYEIHSHESTQQGVAKERGWDDEEGENYTFREAYELLKGLIPSSQNFQSGVWYTDFEYFKCIRSGDVETRSYHLEASENFQRRLFNALKATRHK